jgi:hypothetical protein
MAGGYSLFNIQYLSAFGGFAFLRVFLASGGADPSSAEHLKPIKRAANLLTAILIF